MSLHPTYDRVLIAWEQQQPHYDQDPSHQIVLPDKYQYGGTESLDPAHIGTVVALGPHVSLPLKPGDQVFYGKWSYAKFKYKGKLYVVVKQDDILVTTHGV